MPTNFRTPLGRLELAAALVCLLMLSGCAGNTPRSNARTYLDNLKTMNYTACYAQLSHRDQLDLPLDKFLMHIPLAPPVSRDWFRPVLMSTRYEVGDEQMLGEDKANVKITVTRPDLALWERTVNATLTPDESLQSAAQGSLSQGKYPPVTHEDNVVMVKQGDEWKVYVNFPLKESVLNLRKQALEAYHKHDYEKSMELYQAALTELGKDVATGTEGLRFTIDREIAHVEKVRNEMAEAQAYVEKLELADVDMKMGASRMPGIFGKITNKGDRAIDEVQMTVTYFTGSGKRKKEVFKEERTPIATPLDFIDFARPVLPFVPGETRSFGFRLEAPIEVLEKATPDLEISAVVFTDSSAPLPKLPEPKPEASPDAEATPEAQAGAAAAPPSGAQ
jgi:hypothetical protein